MSLSLGSAPFVQLQDGDHVHFHPVTACDYVLKYEGVLFHVHRVKLMEQSTFFETALQKPYQDNDSEPLEIQPIEYSTMVHDDNASMAMCDFFFQDSKLYEESTYNFQQPVLVKPGVKTTLMQFLEALALVYYSYKFIGADDVLVRGVRVDLQGALVSEHTYHISDGQVHVASEPGKRSDMLPFSHFAWVFKWECKHLLNGAFGWLLNLLISDLGVVRRLDIVVSIWLLEEYRSPVVHMHLAHAPDRSAAHALTTCMHAGLPVVHMFHPSLISRATLMNIIDTLAMQKIRLVEQTNRVTERARDLSIPNNCATIPLRLMHDSFDSTPFPNEVYIGLRSGALTTRDMLPGR